MFLEVVVFKLMHHKSFVGPFAGHEFCHHGHLIDAHNVLIHLVETKHGSPQHHLWNNEQGNNNVNSNYFVKGT